MVHYFYFVLNLIKFIIFKLMTTLHRDLVIILSTTNERVFHEVTTLPLSSRHRQMNPFVIHFSVYRRWTMGKTLSLYRRQLIRFIKFGVVCNCVILKPDLHLRNLNLPIVTTWASSESLNSETLNRKKDGHKNVLYVYTLTTLHLRSSSFRVRLK